MGLGGPAAIGRVHPRRPCARPLLGLPPPRAGHRHPLSRDPQLRRLRYRRHPGPLRLERRSACGHRRLRRALADRAPLWLEDAGLLLPRRARSGSGAEPARRPRCPCRRPAARHLGPGQGRRRRAPLARTAGHPRRSADRGRREPAGADLAGQALLPRRQRRQGPGAARRRSAHCRCRPATLALPAGVRCRTRGGYRIYVNYSSVAVQLSPAKDETGYVIGSAELPVAGVSVARLATAG